MYSVIVYSELITFPCINLILFYLCIISQTIIICILLLGLILYHVYCNLLTSSISTLVDLWNTKYIIIIIIIIIITTQLSPKCEYEMTAGSSLDVRLLWSLTFAMELGVAAAMVIWRQYLICRGYATRTKMVNYEHKHTII